jgi:hypothetical protein
MIASRLDQPCRPGSPRVATPARGSIDVRAIRLSTTGHATGFCGRNRCPVKTLRNWEQGRRQPTGPACVLLALSDASRFGDLVFEALARIGDGNRFHVLEGRPDHACDLRRHVEPHKGDYNKFVLGKLQSLCATCHSSTKAIVEKRGYDTAIGADGMPLDPRHPVYRYDKR